MKIFGIGLNKTGTTSLGVAFETLGFRHFRRLPKLFKLYQLQDFTAIYDAIEGYDSFEDWPWPLMVPQLLAQYGDDAKFVLTRRRTPETWLNSIKAHALRTHPQRNPRKAIYGAGYPQGAEDVYLEKYKQHLRNTRDLFATQGRENQLLELCFEEGEGWRELCAFLEKPRVHGDFPRANASSDADIPVERLTENLAGIEAQNQK